MPRAPSESGSDMSDEPSSVLLALPDGPVDTADAPSHTASFIGGYPTFPACATSSAPESVNCGVCHNPMPLLSQVYCPLVDGENDRTLYVFACPRAGCSRREGSVRAWRASVRNEEYVADVEAKRAEAERIAKEEREKARINPFTVKDAPAASGNLFGSGQPLFGAAPSNPFAAPEPAPAPEPAAEPAPVTAPMAALSIGEPTTLAPPLPAYLPAQYLSTMDEYLILVEEDNDLDSDDEDESPEQKAEWREQDGWDRLLPKGVDDIFERFVRRLESAEDASSQVLRYDFGSVPLPYSGTSPLFKKLFPKAPVRASASEEDEVDLSEYYTTATIPLCPKCKGPRVFEAQLVPQLINSLRPSSLSTTGAPPPAQPPKKLTEAERRAEIARLAKGEGEGEMEWGTVMVFACERDCVGIAEEWVGVEWESALSLAQQ